ncbi:MAG: Gfo/Idh/MocA family oxidoreductase [Candidatus Hydrogenedentes bacterium]|nr:Gfo/Idh/MocA family oxidoreductase [Candidatus Hydrogenedentota bacterium]
MTKQEPSIGRRSFLGGVAGAGLLALTGCVTARKIGPNDRINIGLIGAGRRGRQIAATLPPDAQLVALADVNTARLAEMNAGKSLRTFTDYRKLLESRDVDAVLIATPDHWHTLCSVHACQAGKDVYCEKPLTLTVREGRAMVKAARRYKRVVQTGSQQRSMTACEDGCRAVSEGRVGKIKEVHGANYPSPWECDLPEQPVPEGLNWDMWLGQTPVRPYNLDIYLPRAKPGWISFRPWSGGEMTGWGAHGLDIIQWALGFSESGPVEVWPEGQGLKCPVSFRYANGVVVKLDGKGPDGGGLFVGDKGEILIDRGKFEVREGGNTQSTNNGAPSDDKRHMINWIESIRSRRAPIADVEIGHRTATMCHLGNIARWTGRHLKWDPKKETFPGDADANTYLQRPMRAPYKL